MLLLIFLSSKLTFFWLRVNIVFFFSPCEYWGCELIFNFWLYLVWDICDQFCQLINKLRETDPFLFTLFSGGLRSSFSIIIPPFKSYPLSAVKIDQTLFCSLQFKFEINPIWHGGGFPHQLYRTKKFFNRFSFKLKKARVR